MPAVKRVRAMPPPIAAPISAAFSSRSDLALSTASAKLSHASDIALQQPTRTSRFAVLPVPPNSSQYCEKAAMAWPVLLAHSTLAALLP
jgi:hypothetical protein